MSQFYNYANKDVTQPTDYFRKQRNTVSALNTFNQSDKRLSPDLLRTVKPATPRLEASPLTSKTIEFHSTTGKLQVVNDTQRANKDQVFF